MSYADVGFRLCFDGKPTPEKKYGDLLKEMKYLPHADE